MLKYLFVPAPQGTHAPLLWLKRLLFLTIINYCLMLMTVLLVVHNQELTHNRTTTEVKTHE